MTDKELLEWYKNTSSKPADMSAEEYELNKNKGLNLYKNEQLQTNYQNQQEALKKAESNAQQSASISNEKLMKYLGQKQMSSGIATGQASSEIVNANNNYVQNRATIANNSAQQQADLLAQYNTNKASNDTDAYNNEMAIIEKYRDQAYEDEQRKQANEDRDREIQQWELQMQAGRQELENDINDRKEAAKDKETQAQIENDAYWVSAANDRITAMISSMLDDNGNLSPMAQEQIMNELKTYKDKIRTDEYYNRLLDLFNTYVYNYSNNS